MTDVWSQRAEAFRESPTHREGPTSICSSSGASRATTSRCSTSRPAAATSRGGCARRAARSSPSTRRRACSRTSSRAPRSCRSRTGASTSSPAGSRPTTSRTSARRSREMARVTQRLVVIEDNVFVDERVEEAERLRDPTHVRCYSEDEWKRDAHRGRARGRAARALRAPPGRRGLARPRRDARAETPRAFASCSPTTSSDGVLT